MQIVLLAAAVVIVNAAYVSKSSEVTDADVIRAFLADPDTHAYNVRDPTAWGSFRKVLQLGSKQADGSCKYPLAISTPGNYVSFATEIAVNKVRCQSLIIEGNPGGAVQELVQIPTGIAEPPIASASTTPAATGNAKVATAAIVPAPSAVASVSAASGVYLKFSYVLASLTP